MKEGSSRGKAKGEEMRASADECSESSMDESDDEPLSKKLDRARKRLKVDNGHNVSRETGYCGSTSDSDEPLSQKLARYKAKNKLKSGKRSTLKVWIRILEDG